MEGAYGRLTRIIHWDQSAVEVGVLTGVADFEELAPFVPDAAAI